MRTAQIGPDLRLVINRTWQPCCWKVSKEEHLPVSTKGIIYYTWKQKVKKWPLNSKCRGKLTEMLNNFILIFKRKLLRLPALQWLPAIFKGSLKKFVRWSGLQLKWPRAYQLHQIYCIWQGAALLILVNTIIDPFGLYGLFLWSSDITSENCFLQISLHSCAYVNITYERQRTSKERSAFR